MCDPQKIPVLVMVGLADTCLCALLFLFLPFLDVDISAVFFFIIIIISPYLPS